MTSTALLIMDVQQGIVERFAGNEGYLTRLATWDGAGGEPRLVVGEQAAEPQPGRRQVALQLSPADLVAPACVQTRPPT